MHPDPEIIFGPPGCGKTTRLLSELRGELSRGTEPDRVGFVTFTRKAAQEAQERVLQEFGLARNDVPWFRTLHSLCMRCTGMRSANIFDGAKVTEFAEWIGERITGRQSIDGQWEGYERGDRMMFMTNLARIRRMPLRALYEQDHDDLDWERLDRFARGLEKYKRENHLHDFTDMLEQFVAGNATRPDLEVLFVDEAQDNTLLQWDIVWRLAEGCRRLVIAGDDDQSIFTWAGADVDTLIDMDGQATVLSRSWRVPRAVQRVAEGIIGRVRHRRQKVWEAREAEGSVRWLTDMDEADYAGDSTLVLARNRHQLGSVEAYLRGAGILYEREGYPSVSRATLDSIVAYERLRRGETIPASEAVLAYKLMTVGIGVVRGYKTLPKFEPTEPVTMDLLRKKGGLLRDEIWSVALDRLPESERSYLIKCRRRGERLTRPPRVKLSTIHGSKGGEADRVILMTDLAPRTWREASVNPDSEARVFYVACTRAKEELCIVAPSTPRSYRI